MEEVDGVKLVQLRNPHGEGEWNGDWSDDSHLWNTRMRNVLNYHINDVDGIFWMEWSDFYDEFECVYVCSEFLESDGWKCYMLDDKWHGNYAQGLPNRKKNPGCKYHENPQYTFEVSEHGEAVIVLRMKDRESQSQSKFFGYFHLQDEDGNKIMGPKPQLTLARSGPINSAVQSQRTTLPDDVDYPHKFTLLTATFDKGDEGGFIV